MKLSSRSQPQYTCPICSNKLNKVDQSFICENRHCFDIARDGYVNLLPVQQKKSKNPGDNKIMIQSRQDFLNKHFYDILIEPCVTIIDHFIAERFEQCCLVDIGCGDGFFTRKIYSQLSQPASCYGMDISKEAVKFSAKNDKSIHWFVASFNDIPLANEGVDIILKINAPINYEKCLSKLSDNGIVVSVTPGKSHLDGLKSIIYENPQTHEKEICPKSYSSLMSKELNGQMQLNNETDIKNLFMMTPFYWNASHNSKDKINNLHELESNIAFDINVWGKQ